MDTSQNHETQNTPVHLDTTHLSTYSSPYETEQNFILDTLKHVAHDTDLSQQNFWTLTQYALRNIRSLQQDLNNARAEIDKKQKKIEELEKIATTDALTDLMNRRGFLSALHQEMDRTNRGVTHGGLLIMIDLDNFKTINDTYGHQVGDDALRLVAQTLLAHIRTMDVAARLGGDEFVLMFSNANPTHTSARIQKLARKLNSLLLKHNNDAINVRASIGVQPYQKGDSVQTILHKADMAMYKAKEGKNSR